MRSYIQEYRRKLDELRRIGGAVTEGSLRRAFGALLERIADEHKLILVDEYALRTRDGANIRVDGALLDRLRLVHGYWEAKDGRDDLDREIESKLAKGYPSANILFEDTRNAVLIQNGEEVLRAPLDDEKKLTKLLTVFFDYRPRELEDFDQAQAKFREELPQVIAALDAMIDRALADNDHFQERFAAFHALSLRAIGPRVTPANVREMLIQHVLTEQIFRAIFPNNEFHRGNHLAHALTELELSFLRGEARRELTARLEPYYAAIRRAAAGAVQPHEKQEFLKAVYEGFYTAYNPKDADKLGIVYTPSEAVKFIIAGCDWLTQRHFGKRLADPELDILDPCTGTGTFVVELIDYLRGDRSALIRKYAEEIHANEIGILPYYIACLNIEQAFAEATDRWDDFAGACFINTLENWGFGEQPAGTQLADLVGTLSDENHARIQRQNARRIPVIIGNPPYNANQKNENDNNKNDAAPEADRRIRQTYLAASRAQKTKLYDPYLRFLRWATDRLGDHGVIGFITNRSYLDAKQADGFRISAAGGTDKKDRPVSAEFDEVWIVDLQSDVRRNPKISGTSHNIFGIQTGVAIGFFVRRPGWRERAAGGQLKAEVHYLAIDDFMLALDKRGWLATNPLPQLAEQGAFERITPDARGTWLDQPTEDWSAWLPLADKSVKSGADKESKAIFKLFSLGVVTNRDEWVSDVSKRVLSNKVRALMRGYSTAIENGSTDDTIKWTRSLKAQARQKREITYDGQRVIEWLYRPYAPKFLYFDQRLNEMQYQQRQVFGEIGNLNNIAITTSGSSSSKSFQVLVTDQVPCLDLLEKTQSYPLFVYDKHGNPHDNITDWALDQFRSHYTDDTIDKRDIFDYVYAALHDPLYRERFALNLKQDFPRIPLHPDFRRWLGWGQQLLKLHLGWRRLEPWPLTRHGAMPAGSKPQAGMNLEPTDSQTGLALTAAAPKSKLKADKVAGTIEIDAATRLSEVPASAWDYKLGNRSALDWVLEGYKESTPRDPTVAARFNSYRFADYKEEAIDHLQRVTRVSVETQAIVEQMRALDRS